MIEIRNVTKQFDDICAVNDVTMKIEDGAVFGLIGTNGAGKSTLLRMISGVVRPDKGEILFGREPIYENEKVKSQFFYLSDEQYFFHEATPEYMAGYLKLIYPDFDSERFRKLLKTFQLEPKRKMKTLSKGMKKQVSFLLGICTNTRYLFCDEIFDGLDPVMRQGMKALFAKEVSERNFTPVIASHNLRELEDICDSIGLLHKGGVLLSKDITDLKVDIHKVQFVLQEDSKLEEVSKRFQIVSQKQKGRVVTATIRGAEEEIYDVFEQLQPVFYEVLPLSLEEIFICETEAAGYNLKELL